jgi:hypothetical protein
MLSARCRRRSPPARSYVAAARVVRRFGRRQRAAVRPRKVLLRAAERLFGGRVGGEHALHHGVAVAERRLLRHVADAGAGRARDAAAVGRLVARDDADEGGLAGAVRADQPDLLAGEDAEGGVGDDRAETVALAYVLESDEFHVIALQRPPPRINTTKKGAPAWEPLSSVTGRRSAFEAVRVQYRVRLAAPG